MRCLCETCECASSARVSTRVVEVERVHGAAAAESDLCRHCQPCIRCVCVHPWHVVQ